MYDLSDNTTLKDPLAKGNSGYMLILYSGTAGAISSCCRRLRSMIGRRLI